MKTQKRLRIRDQESARDGPVAIAKERTRLGRHLPYDVGQSNSFPDDANEEVFLIYSEAESFAQKCGRLPPDHAVMLGKKRLASLIDPQRIDAFSETLRAIFWGVSSTLTRYVEDRPETSIHTPIALGGKSQSALTRAFLLMSDQEREETPTCLPPQSELVTDEWVGACLGAFAVARTAYQLLKHRVITILPKRKIDSFARIDLIGKINRADPIHLCFQIKRAGVGVPSTLMFLEDQEEKEQTEEIQIIRRDMKRFSEKHVLRCIPMILWVGNDDRPAWDIRGGHHLHQIMDDLIEYTRFLD